MPLAIVVLAAGLGTRMKSDRPKVMHPLAGRPMLAQVLETAGALAPERIVVVTGPGMASVEALAAPHKVAIQAERLGTAHAVLLAKPALEGFADDVLVLYGDTPLLTVATLEKLVAARRGADRPAIAVLGFRPADPTGYGRLVMGAKGLERIVEEKDATAEERAIGLVNSGVMVIDGARLFPLLAKVGNANAKGEYYLTDLVGLARAEGRACAVVEGEAQELLGINARIELAQAEKIVQDRLRAKAMAGGATLLDPDTIYFSWDTQLGRDVTIGPNVVFGPGVAVGDGVEIRAFCHLEGARIAPGAIIGPFARLRPGAVIEAGAHIGNFVEIKKAVIEEGAKVNHLTYIGDARVGAKANVGAGTITCNYDGFDKGHTDIGKGAFIGSNSALVAPVTIGDGAIVGAGSVITKDVAADSLAVTRSEQKELAGWAARFRSKKSSRKKDKT
ncbi:MAG: bifunctional UDP-N-acetylglucosamine diphosphorylase/glucosamine-1-phosphate N-acetyltransferase GlmU [Rhodospirillales bacterium]|nr:bifunctional UDP-N-acetylglucosamine diphosphorylase/glucosamine-1-phosphate N-acetyltransferase GlmU [Rhodospirillales bacterium]